MKAKACIFPGILFILNTVLASLAAENAPVLANVAWASKVSASPALPPEVLRRLIDGKTRSGATFPVGSKGHGAYTLTFRRPHEVRGIKMMQVSDIYSMARFEVLADRNGDGEFETKLITADAAPPWSWTESRWPAARVQALKIVVTEGLSKGKRAHPILSEIEILGTALPGDIEDARALGNPVFSIAAVRKVNPWVDLSSEDRPTAVLCPEGPEYLDAAKKITEAIAGLGVPKPKVSSDFARVTPADFNVIALGNVNNNELIARLYFNSYSYEDSLNPGPRGFTIRTVYDPYPWHGKGDVVVLGVSDAGRVVPAARDLIKEFHAGRTKAGMDYALHISTAPGLSPAGKKLLEGQKAPSFHVFLSSASRYLKTGNETYARHAILTLERIADLYDQQPDHDCDWPEETNSGPIMATWDAFDECPLMTEEQRFRFTRAFLHLMQSLVHHVSGYSRIGTDDLVAWNHTTFPLLGLYFGARYFSDYYGLEDARAHLKKARACFTAQAKSWKPQEDADNYLILTMRHAIQYALAEWQLDFFKSGRMQQHADYVVGICDSAGLPSGFGDSGIGVNPTLIKSVLPIAFWYTRDPGYLWLLDHVFGGPWPNPFHRDIKPERPNRFTGVKVYPLDRQLYEFTRRFSFYNESHRVPKVPPEKAFDKVAFREGLEKNSQYLLLDGFARGKHLHYDGNAIIEFVDRGRRWLIDHNYLTRNSTEHNMLSVIRNGRAGALVPPCAGLLCSADVKGRFGLVGTEMVGYSGIHWQRYIFWQKGEYFLVLDRMRALEEADYDLDLVWKTEDQDDEELVGEKAFMVRRSSARLRSREISIIKDARASGGKAVLFSRSSSALSFTAELPPGTYSLNIRAFGVDGSSDSLFVAPAGGKPIAFHVPQLHYGPTSARFDHTAATPRVTLTEKKRQLITVTLRERPPVRVDSFTFQALDGKHRLVIEAEKAVPPKETDLAKIPADRFWIKWPDPVRTTVTRTTPKGIVVPVRKLYQRISRHLKIGEGAEMANLLYVDSSQETETRAIERLGPGAVLIRGKETALFAVRGAKVPGLEFDAEMLLLSPSHIAWANGRGLKLPGLNVLGDGRTALELDVKKSAATTSNIQGKPGRVRISGLSAASVRQFLHGFAVRTTGPKRSAPPVAATAFPIWAQTLPNGNPVRTIQLRDLNQDGNSEVLVAAGNAAFAFDSKGAPLWTYALNGTCNDVDAGELRPSPGLEIAVAGGDTYAHLLDSKGHLLEKHQVRGPAWNQNFGDRAFGVTNIAISDLDGDGKNEVVLGTESYELRVYAYDWKLLHTKRVAVLHGSIRISTRDIDGDGKQEILATDHYGYVHLFKSDGSEGARFYSSIGDVQAALADLNGDGALDVIFGSSTGDLICRSLPSSSQWQRQAKILWRFDNFGYGVNRVLAAPLVPGGSPRVVVASQTGYVYVLDSKGKFQWKDRAGTDVVEALLIQGSAPRLAYFDRSGQLTLATGDGKTRKRFSLNFSPQVAVQFGGTLLVGGPGKLAAYRLADLW